MRRLDLYLTRKAQGTWPDAQVFAEYDDRKDQYPQRFVAEFGGDLEPVILVSSETPARSRFRVARDALRVLRRAVRG